MSTYVAGRRWAIARRPEFIVTSVELTDWRMLVEKFQDETNFPRFRNDNTFRNKCGNLSYPLLFAAVRKESGFETTHYDINVLESGECTAVGGVSTACE